MASGILGIEYYIVTEKLIYARDYSKHFVVLHIFLYLDTEDPLQELVFFPFHTKSKWHPVNVNHQMSQTKYG